MSVIHAPEEPSLNVRQLVWPIALLGFFCAFLARLWYLQIVIGDELSEQAHRTAKVSTETMAPRGQIVDRRGRVLATVKSNIVVSVEARKALRDLNGIAKVAQILGQDAEKFLKAVKKASQQRATRVPVYVGASLEQASAISEDSDLLPGFSVDTLALRSYTDTNSLCHVMGFVGVPTDAIQKELSAKDLEPAPYVGRDGIERSYEKDLMGLPGQITYAVDRKGRQVRDLSEQDPVPGARLVLGVDLSLQKLAQSLLAGKRGSIVALDPSTGEVLAICSQPGYDLSLFQNRISQDDYDVLTQDEAKPLIKRAIASAYAPGSTFKLITSIAMYMSGKFNPAESHFCDGKLKIGNRTVKCENHPVGELDFREALTKSCNTYFGTLAREAGITNLHKAMVAVGLGSKTGIDIPGESAGRIPSEKRIHGDKPWLPGDTVNIGIGQGELAVTPLQMVSMVSLVANEGVSYRPHVVRSIVEPGVGSKPQFLERQVLGQVEATPEFWHTLKSAMANVMVNGTGRHAQVAGLTWAGKTGTAEQGPRKTPHAWFVGFAPYERPKIAICCMIEDGGHGGDAAAPLAAQIVDAYLKSQASAAESVAMATSTAGSLSRSPRAE